MYFVPFPLQLEMLWSLFGRGEGIDRTNGDYFEERSYSTLLNRAVSRSKPTRCFAVCARTSTASATGLVALLQTVSASNCLAAPGSSVHTNGRTESLR